MTKQKMHMKFYFIYTSKDVLLGEKTTLCSQWWTQCNLKELQNNYAQEWSNSVKSKIEMLLIRL